jgi:uncharacterized protein YdeI (YjbR/CyaY-like superfamily)
VGFRRDDAPRIHPETADELRAWLAEHHADPDPGGWVVQWHRADGHVPIPFEELIGAALAYGWIDGMPRTVDHTRSELWVTRRRSGSQWTRLSKKRVARQEAAGLMTDAGRVAAVRAQVDGTWSALDEVEDGVVPADLAALGIPAHQVAR